VYRKFGTVLQSGNMRVLRKVQDPRAALELSCFSKFIGIHAALCLVWSPSTSLQTNSSRKNPIFLILIEIIEKSGKVWYLQH